MIYFDVNSYCSLRATFQNQLLILKAIRLLYFKVLERGPYIIQLPVLNIIHCMLHYVDLSSTTSQPFNADLLRVIAKYIEVVYIGSILEIHLTKKINTSPRRSLIIVFFIFRVLTTRKH